MSGGTRMRSSKASAAGRAAERGFTLIEIMMVVIIIGILVAVVVPNVIGFDDDARAQAERASLRGIGQALETSALLGRRGFVRLLISYGALPAGQLVVLVAPPGQKSHAVAALVAARSTGMIIGPPVGGVLFDLIG